MKKLLTLLGAVGLTATASSAVVACGNKDKSVDTKEFEAAAKIEANAKYATIKEAAAAIEKLAKPKGVSKITVTGNEETKKITIKFTVEKGYKAINDMVLDFKAAGEEKTPVIKGAEAKSVEVGKEVTLNITIDNAIEGEKLTVKSSDATIATVAVNDTNVVTVKGLKAGKATITLSYKGAADVTFEATVTTAE
ncbi:hypothetical protein CXP39_01380 [Mesoplasma syrphidae]|uniref:BIG2 domain-containing protein n=1 Tax=Mesoplasma syrphidae TaxID=225999 RepID=A0A2K9CCS2_9MOLU|nr:lipoprotein [Mesoplasma syrphidae]AUF83454.1 hypothetical protein CXP39_01380 [Mesoplasma syrphidae]